MTIIYTLTVQEIKCHLLLKGAVYFSWTQRPRVHTYMRVHRVRIAFNKNNGVGFNYSKQKGVYFS